MNEFVVKVDFDIQHRWPARGVVDRSVFDEPTLQCKLEEYRRQFC
jgi:hypothetical protein